jgi:hypothetical protein
VGIRGGASKNQQGPRSSLDEGHDERDEDPLDGQEKAGGQTEAGDGEEDDDVSERKPQDHDKTAIVSCRPLDTSGAGSA